MRRTIFLPQTSTTSCFFAFPGTTLVSDGAPRSVAFFATYAAAETLVRPTKSSGSSGEALIEVEGERSQEVREREQVEEEVLGID
jgi:hypothetical protein